MSATHDRNRAFSSPFPTAEQTRLKKGSYYKISSTDKRGIEVRSGKHPNVVYAYLIGNVSMMVRAVCNLIVSGDEKVGGSPRPPHNPLVIEHAESFLP